MKPFTLGLKDALTVHKLVRRELAREDLFADPTYGEIKSLLDSLTEQMQEQHGGGTRASLPDGLVIGHDGRVAYPAPIKAYPSNVVPLAGHRRRNAGEGA
jgi:hypothetical protein